MNRDPRTEALALWLHTQQENSRLAQQQQPPGELHLHQHHHAAPTVPAPIGVPEQPQTVRLHPLVFMACLFLLSLALSVPLALIAAISESNRTEVHYIQPGERW